MEREAPVDPPLTAYLGPSLLLMMLGWGGLALVVTQTEPTLGPRWAFFFLLTLGGSGLALPFVALIHRRFDPAGPGVVQRQALEFGVYLATLAWLQLGRALSFGLALFLAVGVIVVEWVLRLREWLRTDGNGHDALS